MTVVCSFHQFNKFFGLPQFITTWACEVFILVSDSVLRLTEYLEKGICFKYFLTNCKNFCILHTRLLKILIIILYGHSMIPQHHLPQYIKSRVLTHYSFLISGVFCPGNEFDWWAVCSFCLMASRYRLLLSSCFVFSCSCCTVVFSIPLQGYRSFLCGCFPLPRPCVVEIPFESFSVPKLSEKLYVWVILNLCLRVLFIGTRIEMSRTSRLFKALLVALLALPFSFEVTLLTPARTSWSVLRCCGGASWSGFRCSGRTSWSGLCSCFIRWSLPYQPLWGHGSEFSPLHYGRGFLRWHLGSRSVLTTPIASSCIARMLQIRLLICR